MKTRCFLLSLLALMNLTMSAQESQISGQTIDRDTKEVVTDVTVQLLSSDSTFITGAISSDQGSFEVTAPRAGSYLLKFTCVGYKPLVRPVKVSDGQPVNLGKVVMGADAVMLKEAQVTAKALKVVMKEDTFIYNSAAYRTPEGSTIEELVKRLPGAKVDENGKITINGKEVKKILVDGKEFMTGDTKIAMKNLPTSIVEKVKAYDEKSDLARVTGIDDGEETTVLDFGLKKGTNRGIFSNIDLSLGTHSRWAERLMGAYFNDRNRFMIFGNANNTNDMGFPGGGGGGRWGGGRQGLNTTKMLGMNYNYELRNHLRIDLSAFWNHANGDAYTRSSAENFVSHTGSFTNNVRQNYTRSDRWNLQGRLEWQPDTMTNIMFRPTLSWSSSDRRSTSTSASFNDDPYSHVTDPLEQSSLEQMAEDSLVVNSQRGTSISYTSDKNLRGMLQLNRKLNSRGRNFTLRADAGYSKDDSKSLSANATRLWLKQNQQGVDSTYQTNRYNLMPTKSYNYRLMATYSEPLFRGAFLQFRYSFRYSRSRSDRSTYDFSRLGEDLFSSVVPAYRGWDNYLNLLPMSLDHYLDSDLSRYSEYRNYINEYNLSFRLIRPKYRLNVGFMVQPQRSKYVQDYQGVHVDTTRSVTNFSPTFDFRYRFSRQHQLRINYRGTTSQPSMSQLLDITDDSNPLNISKGNPGLKPSFTNRLRLDYRNYIPRYMRFIQANLNFSTTRNSISSRVTYDATTGGRTTRPENINGNWSVDGGAVFNTAIDTTGNFNISSFTRASYNNYVAYLTVDRTSDSQKNTTRNLQISENLSGSYRNDWLEVSLDGGVTYNHASNRLQQASNLNTWQFSYGGSVNITAPWGTSLSTDLHQNSRRGYSDNAMNTNELIWNAQISQGFFKGKPLTVMLQFYDLLHQQSNLSRTLSAIERSDTWYNSINSYAMLHVVYRFNLFGGKNARPGRHGPHGGGRPHRPGMRHMR